MASTLDTAGGGGADVEGDGRGGAEGAAPSNNTRQRQQFLRQASAPTFEKTKPPLLHRWLHTTEAAPATSVSGGGANDDAASTVADRKSWNVFGQRDDRALERAWVAWKKEQDERGAGKEKEEETRSNLTLPKPDPDVELPTWRVPVAEDRLFEVDLRTLRLSPVFWKGSANQVLRGTWFLDASKVTPLSMDVARELEELYVSIQPWLSSYADELRSSVAIGSDAEDKLKAPLKTLKGYYAIFLGPHLARIYSDSVPTRITKTIFTAWSGSHGGGTLVARGFDNARRLLKTSTGETPAKPPTSSSSTPKGDGTVKGKKQDSPKDKSGDQSPVLVEKSQDTLGATTMTSADLLRTIASKFGNWTGDSSAARSKKEAIPGDPITQAHSDARGLESAGLGEEIGEKRVDSMTEGKTRNVTPLAAAARTTTMAETEAKEDEEAYKREMERDTEPIELVLVWHGIGQKLADEWKSLDFALAVSSLRSLVHKRASGAPPTDVGGGGIPALAEGRRVQFLPVMWRATLEDFEPPPLDSEHDTEEHLNNRFSLEDIFADSIPLIRQLISGILLDIPLYLSQHKEEILRRVIRESNRIYRLFCQRNPNFLEQGGRTSLIAHSLGAALATDILSKQPTSCRPFKELHDPGAELAFDVRNLYLVGSPVALFMWLNQSQLIARRGRRPLSSNEAPPDEALERAGRWGCLAVDRIFNVFSATDPIGTKLNSTVDARQSKDLSTVTLARATKSILRTLPGALDAPAVQAGKGFFAGWTRAGGSAVKETEDATAGEDRPDGADLDLLASSPTGDGPKAKDAKWLKKLSTRKAGYKQKREESTSRLGSRAGEWEGIATPTAAEEERRREEEEELRRGEKGKAQSTASSFDMSTADAEEQSRDRAQRRMRALNELGSIDFIIPPQPSLLTNQYMEFLWSHAGYWTDVQFGDFLLTTLMADSQRLNEARDRLDKEP